VIKVGEEKGEHVIEAIGRCRILISKGKVIDVSQPLIRKCPLARRFSLPVNEITPQAVRENIEHRIRSFGMCSRDRQLLMTGDFVGFGASELISFGLSAGIFDAAVIACEGAGTVIATTPELVQGIGGRMSGLIRTAPIPEVIAGIELNGGIVPFREDARIDQAEGVRVAHSEGLSRIAVTIVNPLDAPFIHTKFPGAFIIAVHTTGISARDAQVLAEHADIVTSCASQAVRDIAGKRALLQAGSSIPVFVMTQRAKSLLLGKVEATSGQFVITGAELPFRGNHEPEPLV
jgi:putative methanogenesis marker protein 8